MEIIFNKKEYKAILNGFKDEEGISVISLILYPFLALFGLLFVIKIKVV